MVWLLLLIASFLSEIPSYLSVISSYKYNLKICLIMFTQFEPNLTKFN